MNNRVKKSTIYHIPGDTVNERKRAVQQLLRRFGCEINLKQITQTRGVLSVHWEPPFNDQFLKRMESFARYGAVFFGPDGSEARLTYIDLVFEREPGLFMDDLIVRRPIILESLNRLPHLLSGYVQWMQKYEREVAEARREAESKPEAEPE